MSDTEKLVPSSNPHGSRRCRVRWPVIAVGIGLLVLVAALAIMTGILVQQSSRWTRLEKAIWGRNIMERLKKLEGFAKDFNNSRSPLHAYPESAAYLQSVLKTQVSCDVSQQAFPSLQSNELAKPSLSVVSPQLLALQYGVDFAGMRYGGNGTFDFEAPVSPIPNGGCVAADYANFTAGNVALVVVSSKAGDCDLITKGLAATDAGARGILFANDIGRTSLISSRVRLPGYTKGDRLVLIPCLAISYSVGSAFSSQPSTVHMVVSTQIVLFETFNTICDTHSGDADNVLVVGAHLDSVPAGPGINDDGSGSMSLLEIAVQWSSLGLHTASRVRFCWWGSEEEGLIGSRFYVKSLNASERGKIAGYINMDMLGSPNFVRYVYRASDSLPEAVNGSLKIQESLGAYFDSQQLPFTLTPMLSGSDFVPFMEVGIPTSGVLTGAGSIKTSNERAIYGGFANAAYDPCYHLACDTVANVNVGVLEDMARAAAHALFWISSQSNLKQWLLSSQ